MFIHPTQYLRRFFIGSDASFTFKPVNRTKPFILPKLDKIDLYIHIPFCKSICPYCPYNKIHYDQTLVEPYLKAILSEIEFYYKQLGKIKIPSIYIGGGTPTTLIDELGIILDKIKSCFDVTGETCIETSPSDIIDQENIIEKLTDYGINMVSLGVQSFDDKYLRLIGRDYKTRILYPTIEKLLAGNFKTVNIDLMFALPGQTVHEVMNDLQTAINAGVNQITLYPLFTFPYSTAGKYLKIQRFHTTPLLTRRKMYHAIHEFCTENGFHRISIWGFKRGNAPRYSSVTRDNYIGLGAGAGSHLPGIFYLNTFVVKVYIKTCLNNDHPISLAMKFTESMTKYYWLYWQFYNTYIDKKKLLEKFGPHNKKINILFRLCKIMRWLTETETHYILTAAGAFWIHFMQNYYILRYINKTWSLAMKDPWPKEIPL